MDDLQKLLPCPFCGGQPYMASEPDPDTGAKFYFVKCRSCLAKGPESYVVVPCPISFGAVRDAWNIRTSTLARQVIAARKLAEAMSKIARHDVPPSEPLYGRACRHGKNVEENCHVCTANFARAALAEWEAAQ